MAHCNQTEGIEGIEDKFGDYFVEGLDGGAVNTRGVVDANGLRQYISKRERERTALCSISLEGSGVGFVFVPSSRSRLNPYLLAQLDDQSQPVHLRTSAIDDLVESVVVEPAESRSDLASVLIDVLDDNSRAVQVSALHGLGRLRDRNSQKAISELVTTSKDSILRCSALEALVQIDTLSALPYVRESLVSRNVCAQIVAVRVWAKRGNDVRRLINLLKSDSPVEVRLTVLESLEKDTVLAEETWHSVSPMLNDTEPRVRREAVDACGRLGQGKAVSQIVALVRSDKDASVRQVAAFVMGKLITDKDRSKIEEALLQVLKHDKEFYVREAAAYSLGGIKGPVAARALVGALKSPNERVRRTAVDALGDMKYIDGVDGLIDLLEHDENGDVRRAAATALGKIGDSKAVRPLLQAIKDKDVYVRSAAEQSLKQFGTEVTRSSSISALKDGNPRVRLKATLQIARMREPAVVPDLLGMLSDDDYNVRQAAIAGLSSFAEPPQSLV
jgi:HEAT repeat protein